MPSILHPLDLGGTDLKFHKVVNKFRMKFWPWKQYGEYGQYEDGGRGFQGCQNKNQQHSV
jgi:hypothetical protein